MTIQTPTQHPWDTRQARNAGQLAFWTLAWVASLALAKFGPGALWAEQSATTLALVGLNIALGFGLLLSNKRYLHALDELQRAVQLNAMGWALGAGLVGGTSWKLIEAHDLVAFNAGIPELIMLMAVVYLVAVIVGTRRYL